jgi:hypothetical protein
MLQWLCSVSQEVKEIGIWICVLLQSKTGTHLSLTTLLGKNELKVYEDHINQGVEYCGVI